MLDSIYKLVQALVNKEQLGYIRPIDFNLYVNNGCNKLFNKAFIDLKTNTRKMNWHLDGRNLADYSEFHKQMVEHFTEPDYTLAITNGYGTPPDDMVFILDIYNGTTPIDKVDYSDFQLMGRNNYVAPTECTPICSKVGSRIAVSPTTITTSKLFYIRKPKTAKWTFEEVDGKPMYDPTKNDFQEVDIPYSLKDELVTLVFEMACKELRETAQQQLLNQDQQQEYQQQNNQ